METLLLKPIQKAIPARWSTFNFNTKDILVALAVTAIVLLFLNDIIAFGGAVITVLLLTLCIGAYELYEVAKGDYNISLENLDLSDLDQELWR